MVCSDFTLNPVQFLFRKETCLSSNIIQFCLKISIGMYEEKYYFIVDHYLNSLLSLTWIRLLGPFSEYFWFFFSHLSVNGASDYFLFLHLVTFSFLVKLYALSLNSTLLIFVLFCFILCVWVCVLLLWFIVYHRNSRNTSKHQLIYCLERSDSIFTS